MNKVKTFFVWLARGLVGILLAVFTVLLVRERKANDFETVAEGERQKAEDAVRATPPRTVAERYDGVGDAVEAEIDSLLGSKQEFSRQEVAELMSNILSDADEEIERTAQEAAREVAAQDAGEIAFQKSLAESWKNEVARIDGERTVWRTCTVIEAIVIIGGMLLFGLTR